MGSLCLRSKSKRARDLHWIREASCSLLIIALFHVQILVRCERPRLNIAAFLQYSVRRAATESLKIPDHMHLVKVLQFVSDA